jgi:hypothetical protein
VYSSHLCLILVAIVIMVCDSAPATAGMFTIGVTNTTDMRTVLDDLTAIYPPGSVPPSKVVVPAMSGIVFTANQTMFYDNLDFMPASYVISSPVGPSTTIKVTSVTQNNANNISWLFDPLNNDPLFLDIDTSLANPIPPSVGTILDYTNGLDAATPGWFVGTSIDETTGDVTNPYSGSAEVLSNAFSISVVPEPSGIVPIFFAFGPLVWMKSRLRSKDHASKLIHKF